MKKITVKLLALALVAALAFAGCAGQSSSQSVSASPSSSSSEAQSSSESVSESETVYETPMRVLALKGPTGIGMVNMMDNANYTFTLAASPEEAVAAVANGSVDAAAVPTNLAATLYAKTGGTIQAAAAISRGMLYILEQGDTVKSIADLKGKTIVTSGQGANPEYILNALLEKNGLTPGVDVTLDFRSEHAEVLTLAAEGSVDIVMLPEPNVTVALMKNANLRVALDLTQEWNAAFGGQSELYMSTVIVSRDYAEKNPEQTAQFLKDLENSINAATTDVDTAAQLCADYGIIANAAAAKNAIPRCGLTYIAGDEMKSSVSVYLQTLYDQNPKSVGGKLPDDDFYYHP